SIRKPAPSRVWRRTLRGWRRLRRTCRWQSDKGMTAPWASFLQARLAQTRVDVGLECQPVVGFESVANPLRGTEVPSLPLEASLVGERGTAGIVAGKAHLADHFVNQFAHAVVHGSIGDFEEFLAADV